MKVFIVIPAYNEEGRIINVIKDLKASNYDNIVVVDDCSLDDTYKAAKSQNVFVLRHIVNRGQGATLQTGMDFAYKNGAEIIVHFDADGQMQVKDIKKFIQTIETEDYQVVLGSRYLNKMNKLPWLKRFIYFPIGRIINLIFTGLWLSDAHCGFRALTREAYEKISIRQDRMAHATEILEKISFYRLKYKEIPVDIRYNDFGQGLRGINGAFQTVKDLVKAKFFK